MHILAGNFVTCLVRSRASRRFNRRSGTGARLTGGHALSCPKIWDATARVPPMSAKLPLHQVKKIAHFVHPQQKCRAEKYRGANENCAEEGAEFFEETQMFPSIEPPVIPCPAN